VDEDEAQLCQALGRRVANAARRLHSETGAWL